MPLRPVAVVVVVLATTCSRMWKKIPVIYFLLMLLLAAQPINVANALLLVQQKRQSRFSPSRLPATTLLAARSSATTPKQIKNKKIHHVKKVSQKLHDFGSSNRQSDDADDEEQQQQQSILFIDGNNVRGISKFQTYSPIELTCHVEVLCQIYKIPTYVMVWDHGTYKYATIHNQEGARNISGITLFSGMTQRADDIIVQETQRLQHFGLGDGHPCGCCVVTNDSGLQFRLRNMDLIGRLGDGSSDEDSAIEFFNRRRGRSKKKNNNVGEEALSTPPSSSSQQQSSALLSPLLIIDSTNFVELLSSIDENDAGSKSVFPPGDTTSTSTDGRRKLLSQSLQSNDDLVRAMKQVHDSMQEFSKHVQQQRKSSKSLVYKYNPKREKTWERCIQAEMLQRAYIARPDTSGLQPPRTHDGADDEEQQQEETSSFGIKYLKDLESRGFYCTTTTFPFITNADVHGDQVRLRTEPTTTTSIPGPVRLDKRQKRLLQRFNAALQQGTVPISDSE